MACNWPSSQSMWCSSSLRIFSASSRRACVVSGCAELYSVIQALDRVVFELQIVLELRLDRSSNVDFEVVGHVRRTVEIQNSLHALFGMHHFLDGFLLRQLGEPLVAPVLAHFRVQEVLIDGRQLRL